MKGKIILFLLCATFGTTALYAGFIEPTSFPKVAADLSFVDRMALNSAGYEPYESEYDKDGNCISGCSYSLPKWEDEIAAMERWNAMVKQDLVENYNYTENDDGTITPPEYSDDEDEYYDEDDWNIPFPGESSPGVNDVATNAECAVRNTAFENRPIPYRSPLGFISCISSPYGPRTLFGRTFHHGIDLRAATGTPVYSPANGVVKLVFRYNPSCGNGVVIEHSNGYATKYCHFSQVSVTRGQQVSAGCLIDKTGNTGQSTGPHLHYSVLKNGKSADPINFIEPEHKMCH